MPWRQDGKLGGTADIFRPMCIVRMGFFVRMEAMSNASERDEVS